MSYSNLTAADLLRQAEKSLGRPAGWFAARLVGFELTLPPATHTPPHGWAEVVATWDNDPPTVSEIVAVGRALAEGCPACRAVYAHADAGVLCHQIGAQFLFASPALSTLPIQ